MESKQAIQRVLVVEDDSTLAFALKEMLADHGYAISIAKDGDEALRIFRHKPFDIIITDLKMPGISGIELLKRAKEISPSTEVIVVTAYGSIETAIEALRLHAFDFILKPYPMNRLIESVKKALDWSFKERAPVANRIIARPVFGILTGSENISISWDNEPDEKITYMLDVCNLNGRVTISFLDMTEEIVKRKQDIISEIRGFIRSGILRRKSLWEITLELNDYIQKAYGITDNWRFFTALHEEREGCLKIYWKGKQKHIFFDSENRKAKDLISNLTEKRLQNGNIEYQLEFKPGDTVVFLPLRTYEYLVSYAGAEKILTLMEKIWNGNDEDIASRIRNSVKGYDGANSPGIIALTSKPVGIFRQKKIIGIKTNLSGNRELTQIK